MRIDTEHPLGRQVRVFLDGALQEHAVAADDTKGYVERYLTTEDGQLIAGFYGFATEIVHGRVEFFLGQFPVVGWKQDGSPILRML